MNTKTLQWHPRARIVRQSVRGYVTVSPLPLNHSERTLQLCPLCLQQVCKLLQHSETLYLLQKGALNRAIMVELGSYLPLEPQRPRNCQGYLAILPLYAHLPLQSDDHTVPFRRMLSTHFRKYVPMNSIITLCTNPMMTHFHAHLGNSDDSSRLEQWIEQQQMCLKDSRTFSYYMKIQDMKAITISQIPSALATGPTIDAYTVSSDINTAMQAAATLLEFAETMNAQAATSSNTMCLEETSTTQE
ncbi:hypothetical protein 3 [Hubei picorna-like virus 71]|uniref:hypothetical protein 3 n=1 Tax=Hubei picorna-like virus 71 TaxID=1923155 RepID=UPI00090C6D42|nr:hypothetical protein 3 [Hubei picorna-like virus 71]APG77433.1 hypothetical protein 3 [Hubei picorna-like virus 71]